MKFKPGMLVQVKEGRAKSAARSIFDLDARIVYTVKRDLGDVIQLEDNRSYTASRFIPANLTPLEKVIYGAEDT